MSYSTNRTVTQHANVRQVRLKRNGGANGTTDGIFLFTVKAGKWNGSTCVTPA